MMKCPNSSHSAGLNACKPWAAVNIKRQSIKLSIFTMVCFQCHTVFFFFFNTCYTKYTVRFIDFCTCDISSHSSGTDTLLLNITIYVSKLLRQQNSINFSSAESHINLFKPTNISQLEKPDVTVRRRIFYWTITILFSEWDIFSSIHNNRF
jgi:hypothetical protein